MFCDTKSCVDCFGAGQNLTQRVVQKPCCHLKDLLSAPQSISSLLFCFMRQFKSHFPSHQWFECQPPLLRSALIFTFLTPIFTVPSSTSLPLGKLPFYMTQTAFSFNYCAFSFHRHSQFSPQNHLFPCEPETQFSLFYIPYRTSNFVSND